MTAEVVMARSPERVVASPYVGRKNGSIVMMKMPKPKPVVRCTKLAPMLNRNMAITTLLIIPFSPCFHETGDRFLFHTRFQLCLRSHCQKAE